MDSHHVNVPYISKKSLYPLLNIQKFEILFQSSVSEGIFKYLSINELVQLRLVNRKANYILRHEESMVRLLSTSTLSQVIKLRD